MSTEIASGQPEGQSLPAAEQQNVTGTENPAEQQPKTFTQAELDAIVQRRAAKAERKAQAQIEQIRQEMATLKEPKPAESKSQDPEPNRKDFDSYESFVEARAEWRAAERVKKELQAYESKSKEKETKAKQDESAKAFQKRVAAVIEKGQDAYPDFDSVINEAVEDDIIPIDSAMYHGVIDSDMAHELAYFLAKNPAEAKRILAMSPYGQARELGKLEDKLSAKKQPREGMETISGRNQSPSGLRDNLSDDAWIKARDKQVRASRS